MIDYETFIKIKTSHERDGLSCRQIAHYLGIDHRTVYKWLSEKAFRRRKSTVRASKLDPFKDRINGLLERYPYTATQIFQRICEEGFTGGYSIVKDYVRKVRPRRSQAFLKLSFAPGQCAQVDWGSYGSINVGATKRRLSFFVMVLCYSRMMYVEFCVSQTMEHFLGAHQNAFNYFGGVPRKIMVDNLKSAVLRRTIGDEPVLNPKYFDFSNHYGFTIAPCNVGKGNEKGRVENAVGYVKKNFLAGLELTDFAPLNPAASIWQDTVANVRIHGETSQKPVDRFAAERNHLIPLPKHPYDIANVTIVRASKQFRVTLDANRYSVPARYAGCRLTLKTYPDRLCIYDQDKLVARHIRSYDRRKDFELPDHALPLLAQRKKARDQKIFVRFLCLSNKAEEYYHQLEQRRMNPLHHIRQIVALSDIYGTDAVAVAMEDAFTFAAFSCEYIANLLEQRHRIQPEPGPLYLTRNQDLLTISVQQPDLSIYDNCVTARKEKDNDR